MSCIKPIIVKQSTGRHRVPCGKCAFCLKAKRDQWLFRLHHETRTQQMPAYFLTLTYDEKHVPRKKGVKTLYFRHLQLYFKKIRKEGYNIKYVAVGEYGSQTLRPHYHAILWTTASCEVLSEKWHHGSVHFGNLTAASIAYTLKYIVQPKQGDNETKQRSRLQASKGIGASYLTAEVHEYHSGDEENPVFESRIDGAVRPLPRYYRTKIFTKYQLGLNRDFQTKRATKQYRDEYRRLMKFQPNVKDYIKQRQRHNADQIVTKTKFNQVL